ncbi:glycosyltransferase family 8 protein [Terribacillus sp. 179-K 1B1 HS]|uniref:glycosyltransferase family 8 protein n=1 Tax=Terribacillus sp. 179-K 1B1 HS TaxID=3142388 RepID=UPI00399FBCA4
MNIIYALNEKFGQHLFNSVTSLLSSTERRDITLYIIHRDISIHFMNKFNNFFVNFNVNINFVNLSELNILINDLPTNNKISIEAYFRLFIGRIINKDEDRAIYLDCDTIVNSPIEDLYYLNIDNKVIGAVEDALKFNKKFPDFIENLSLTNYNYFNSGVMLINLKLWREKNIENKLLNFLTHKTDKIIYHDQDVLNSILNLEWYELDYAWNVQTFFVNKVDRYLDSFNHPKIIHYIGKKPNEYGCVHPLIKYYNVYNNYLIKKNVML